MFYEYRQNNTFGTWVKNADVDIWVIIEADNVEQANERAESVGLYFDGCSDAIDCPCCGDRWSPAWDQDEGDKVPSTYGRPVGKTHKRKQKNDDIVIHYEKGDRLYADSEK